jgi:hypothetical protein
VDRLPRAKARCYSEKAKARIFQHPLKPLLIPKDERVNEKAQRGRWAFPLFLTYYFKYTKWSETTMPTILEKDVVWFEGNGEFSTDLGVDTFFTRWGDLAG